MLFAHLRRGLVAGAAGGVVYGLFVASVVVSLVELAESFEAGGHEAAVSATTTVVVSVGGGVLWGLFLGLLVFGAVYYFFEPAIPGEGATRSYLLGAAGFVTVSGAPWLVLPPLPPGHPLRSRAGQAHPNSPPLRRPHGAQNRPCWSWQTEAHRGEQ